MIVIWGRTKPDAEEFRRKNVAGRGAIVAGNHMARSIEGLKPTGVIQLDGAGEGADGKEMREVLTRAVTKSQRPVPWIDLRGQLA